MEQTRSVMTARVNVDGETLLQKAQRIGSKAYEGLRMAEEVGRRVRPPEPATPGAGAGAVRQEPDHLVSALEDLERVVDETSARLSDALARL